MRILLADDRKNIRSGLTILLEDETGLCVVGEAIDLQELLAKAQELAPDLVLLDWELPGKDALDVIPELRRLFLGIKIIALSSRPEAKKAAISSGVDAFISKGDQPDKLLETIKLICDGVNK